MIELLEFTLLMRLFALFILVVFVLGWLEVLILPLYTSKLYGFIISSVCLIILILWFFIHNAILIYNITNK